MSSEVSSSRPPLTSGSSKLLLGKREDAVVLSRGQCLYDVADLESIPMEEAKDVINKPEMAHFKEKKGKPVKLSSSKYVKASKGKVSTRKSSDPRPAVVEIPLRSGSRPASAQHSKVELSSDYFNRSMYGTPNTLQPFHASDRPRSAHLAGSGRVSTGHVSSRSGRPRSALGSMCANHFIAEDEREGVNKHEGEGEEVHHQHHLHPPSSARPMSALSGMSTRPNSAMQGHGKFLSDDGLLPAQHGRSPQLQTLSEQPGGHRHSVAGSEAFGEQHGRGKGGRRGRGGPSPSSPPRVPVVIGKKLEEYSMGSFFDIQMAIVAGKRDLRRLQIQSQVAHQKKEGEETASLQLQVETLKREFNKVRSARIEKEKLLAKRKETTAAYLAEVVPDGLLDKKIERLKRANDELCGLTDKQKEKSWTLHFMLRRLDDLVEEESKMLQAMKNEVARVSSLNQWEKQRCGVVKHDANMAVTSLKARRKLIEYDHCSWNLFMSKRKAREEKERSKVAQLASEGVGSSGEVGVKEEEEGNAQGGGQEEISASRRGRALYRLLDHEEKTMRMRHWRFASKTIHMLKESKLSLESVEEQISRSEHDMSVLHEASGRTYAESIVERFFDCKENKMYWERLAREQEEELQQLHKEHEELADILIKSKYLADASEEGKEEEMEKKGHQGSVKVGERRDRKIDRSEEEEEEEEDEGWTPSASLDLTIETKFREMVRSLQGKMHRAKLAKKQVKQQLKNRLRYIHQAQYGVSVLSGRADVLENDDKLMKAYDEYLYAKKRDEDQKALYESLSKGEGASSGIGDFLSKLHKDDSWEHDDIRGVRQTVRSLNHTRDLLITALKLISAAPLVSAEETRRQELSFDLDVENLEEVQDETPQTLSNSTSFRKEGLLESIPRVGRTILDKRALEKALSSLKDGQDSVNTNFVDLSDSANNCRISFPNEKVVKTKLKLMKKIDTDMAGEMEEALSRFSIKEMQAKGKHVHLNLDEDEQDEGVQLHHHHHVDPVQYEIVQFKDGEEEEEEEEEGAFDREWEAQRRMLKSQSTKKVMRMRRELHKVRQQR
ncbi:hypothetical protein GUITHDRAFT_101165 [Guillardia theta CCMP2712]|uniref:Uncharacterized protein n=1 Tax=Guillardia theta (strain CCMP2712) TaxID=905079 RepID=L1JZD2_GUITC|nr:hypothetical protein GUITHDRAFT_101165 [Guillardia theta CCMP2712]EKX53463.1 hypothetical protein GUITHDRAFT_101165 [Guillardia theta CCMP2712]|eukprot:XP_005840443.1 hypothetical protein GUITHDRAFT_101165 [Guillardia theta CCMP2712]